MHGGSAVVRLLVAVAVLAPVTCGAPTTETAASTPAGATTSAPTTAVAPEAPPTVSVTANRSRFSPNGDGNADRVTLRVAVSGPAQLTDDARRSGTVVDTLLTGTHGPAPTSVTWDGRNAAGHRVGDGRVELRATVVDSSDQTASDSVVVVVDTTGPRFSWRASPPSPRTAPGPSRPRSTSAASRSRSRCGPKPSTASACGPNRLW